MDDITNNDTTSTIEYRGFKIDPREVINARGLHYTRYVVLNNDGSPTNAAALTQPGAQAIVDTLIRRAEIEIELAAKAVAAEAARTIPEARDHFANVRKLGRRDIDAHPLI